MTQKKKLLLVTYYFPPSKGVGGFRIFNFAEKLGYAGFHVDVITRSWSGNEKTWGDYMLPTSNKTPTNEETSFGNVHKVPHPGFVYKKSRLARLFQLLKLRASGIIHPEINTLFFKNYILSLSEKNKYHVIIVSSPPLNIIRLGKEVSETLGIPMIADFRDFENWTMLKIQNKSIFEKIKMYNIQRYLNQNLSTTVIVTTINEIFAKYFFSKFNKKSMIILNGYNSVLINSIKAENLPEQFTISTIGNLFHQQNLEIFLTAVNRLICEGASVKINFIGSINDPVVQSRIDAFIPKSNYWSVHRVAREDALRIGKESHVLYNAAWPGYKGMSSTKVFDYIGLRKNILIAPGDNDVMEHYVKICNAGRTCNTVEQTYSVLKEWYQEFIETGTLKYNGTEERIAEFSSDFQLKKFIGEVKKIIN